MRLYGLGNGTLPSEPVERSERAESRRTDGIGRTEIPDGTEERPQGAERLSLARRRVVILRRPPEVWKPEKNQVAQSSKPHPGPNFSFRKRNHRGEDQDDEEGQGEDADKENGGADDGGGVDAVDFAVLSNHLQQLDGMLREVTLYLPSLGRVTARLRGGAVTIHAFVPLGLFKSVRRGEAALRERLKSANIQLAEFRVQVQEESADAWSKDVPVSANPAWSQSSLVDVMA